MSKDAFYFSHDGNARNDDKMIAVRMKYGMEGYGIYFAIIERLRESCNYMCIKDYNIVAFDLRVGADKVKSIIEDFNLFSISEDKNYFYSQSLINRMIPLDNLKEQRSLAGKKSGEKRSKKTDHLTVVERSLHENATKKEINKEEEINKESKENFDFDFLNENPEYLILIKKWIEYKKQISSPVETQMQLEAIYKDLLILSNNSTVEAEKIINYSIGGKCKNLYQREIKPANNESRKNNTRNNSEAAKRQGGYGEL